MKTILLSLATVALVAFPVALLEYIGGCVILPEMGLTAPGYWPWYWTSVLGITCYAVLSLITELFKS